LATFVPAAPGQPTRRVTGTRHGCRRLCPRRCPFPG